MQPFVYPAPVPPAQLHHAMLSPHGLSHSLDMSRTIQATAVIAAQIQQVGRHHGACECFFPLHVLTVPPCSSLFQLQQQLSSSTSTLIPIATQSLPVASPQPQLQPSLSAFTSAAANHPSLCLQPSAFLPLQSQHGLSLAGSISDIGFEGSDDAQVCAPVQMMALC